MVENEKNRFPPSFPTIPFSVYFRDFCVLKNYPFCVQNPQSDRRQSAVWASAERRLPCRLSADGASSVRGLTAGKAPSADRFVRRLPTLRPPSADSETADKLKVKSEK